MSESATTLGQFLRQERERRGITIEQVASATRISVRSLLALEADQYGDLPAKPFVRGFVTSYARFIHLDPQEILTRFDDFISQKVSERPARDSGHSGYVFERKESENSRTVLWVVIGVFVFLGALSFLIFKPSLKHGRKSHVEKLQESLPKPVASATPAVSSSNATSTATSTSTSTATGTSASAAPSPAPVPTPVAASPTPLPVPSSKVPAIPLVLARLARPEATPKPSVRPHDTQVQVPPAAATPSAAQPQPAASPSVKPDPLNSGADIPRDEVKQKVVIKAVADVRIRYKVDDKPVAKLILRTGRILVLRARDVARFQVSDPNGVNFSLNNTPAVPLTSGSGYAMRRGIGTLIFPTKNAESEAQIFASEGSLENPGPPPQRSASPAPSTGP